MKGETSCEQHEGNKPYLMKDRAWVSWEWSVQQQGSGGSWVTSLVVSSWFAGTNHKKMK